MKTNKQKTNKQALLNHTVLCSLLAAGFFCSWGAAAPVYAAVATQKVVNSDLAGGLETNSESVKVTGGSRITGTVKVINDANYQTGAHGSAFSIQTDGPVIFDGDGDVEIRTYNDDSYAHTNAIKLHNDGASLLVDKAGHSVTLALDAAGGQSTKYDEVAGIYLTNNNQNVVINADNVNFENNGYNRGYGIWTGASAVDSIITINGNANFSDDAAAKEAYAIRHDHGTTVINGNTKITMVGAGGSGIRAINGAVQFNGDTVIDLKGDVAYIDRNVPAFGIWNGATPYGVTPTTGAHIKLTGNTTITTTGAGSMAVVTELAGGTTEFFGDTKITTGGDVGKWGRGSGTDIGAHGVYNKSGITNFHGNLFVDTTGASATAIHALSGQVNLNNYDGGAQALAVNTTAKDEANGIYNNKAAVTANSHVNVFTKGANASAVKTDGESTTILNGRNYLNTYGDNSHGIEAYAASSSKGTEEKTAQVKLGADSTIYTQGAGSHGVYADMLEANVALDKNNSVTTKGDGSHGLYAARGVIETGGGLQLAAEGTGSHAAYADSADSGVKFNGNAVISAADPDSYAIYADNDSKIEGLAAGSKFTITGNMLADNGGSIQLDMAANSLILGTAAVENSGAIDLEMNDSMWRMTGTSSVTSLTNNKSVIDMTQDGSAFSSFTTENLSGNGGYFVLDIDATTNVNNSDRIYVTDTFSGTQAISLNEITGLYTGTEAENTVLASVKNNNGTFTAVDGEGTLYYQRYELDQKANTYDPNYTTDWYLKSITNIDPEEKPTPGVDGAVSAGALAYYTWLDHDQLMKRLGDLRHKGEDEKGIWVRVKGAKIGRNGNFGFKNKYTHYELGYDEIMKAKPNYTRYGGVSVSYADGDASYSRGSGDNNSRAINFYVTEMGNKGHYLDVVLRFHHMDSNFKMFDEKGQKIRGDMHNVGVSLSGEYGRKKAIDDRGWYIEPQGQLTLGYLGGDDYTTTNGIDVSQGGIRSALGRLGFNIGKDIDVKTNIYVKANLLHEFGGGYDATLTDRSGARIKVDRSFKDTWFEYGIGAAIQTGSNNHIFLDFERSAGGDFKKDWSWNVGARWTF